MTKDVLLDIKMGYGNRIGKKKMGFFVALSGAVRESGQVTGTELNLVSDY